MQWCLHNGFNKIHLEADSALLIHWLNNSATPPWNLDAKVHDLMELCKQCEDFKCSHVYREGNFPVDSLSKIIHDLPIMTHYHNIVELPTYVRGQIYLDKIRTPLFRHKRTRRIHILSHLASSSSNGYGSRPNCPTFWVHI